MPMRAPLIAFALVLAASRPSAASVVVKHDEASLTRAAHAVVLGQVATTESAWDASGAYIRTDTRVRVEDVVKGDVKPGHVITVRKIGGSIGDYNQEMIGAARFKPGERVLLFLERVPDRAPGLYRTVGLSAGKFVVSMDATTGRAVAVSDARDLHYAGTARAVWDRGPVDLEDLLARVRRHAGSR